MTGASVNTSQLLGTGHTGGHITPNCDTPDETTCKTPESSIIDERKLDGLQDGLASDDEGVDEGMLAYPPDYPPAMAPPYMWGQPDTKDKCRCGYHFGQGDSKFCRICGTARPEQSQDPLQDSISPRSGGTASSQQPDNLAADGLWAPLVPLVKLEDSSRSPEQDSSSQDNNPKATSPNYDDDGGSTTELSQSAAVDSAWEQVGQDPQILEAKASLLPASAGKVIGLEEEPADLADTLAQGLTMQLVVEEEVGALFSRGLCEVSLRKGRVDVKIKGNENKSERDTARFVLLWVPPAPDTPFFSMIQELVSNELYVRPSNREEGSCYSVAIPRSQWGQKVNLFKYAATGKVPNEEADEEVAKSAAPVLIDAHTEITRTHDPEGYEVVVKVHCEAGGFHGTFSELKIVIPCEGLAYPDFRSADAKPTFEEHFAPEKPHFAWVLSELHPGIPQDLVAHIYTTTPFVVNQVHASFECEQGLVSGSTVYVMDEDGHEKDFPVLEDANHKKIVREVLGKYYVQCAKPKTEPSLVPFTSP